MIPTRSKAKLPKALSYPLGAEAISDALAGAPHVGELSLRFHGQAVWPATKFNRLVRERLPYRILSVAYVPSLEPGRGPAGAGVEGGGQPGHWSITVYPVLRDLRPASSASRD